MAKTVNGAEFTHPSTVRVYVKVVEPAVNAATFPPLSMVATDGLLLTQFPPDEGVIKVFNPAQRLFAPPITGLDGMLLKVTPVDATEIQLFEFVTVNV